MAVTIQFGPSLFIGGVPPSAFGGRAAVTPLVPRASADPRPLPAPKVSGDGAFRFPHPGGVGLFRPPLIQINTSRSNFIRQAESEVSPVITLRGTTVNVTV